MKLLTSHYYICFVWNGRHILSHISCFTFDVILLWEIHSKIHFQFILRYCHHFCCVVVTLWFTSPKLTRPIVIKLGENVHGNVLYKYMYVNSNNKNPLQKQEALRYQKIMLIHPIICQFKKITMSLWGFWLQTVWSKEYKKF